MSLSNEQLQAILDRKYKGLDVSGLGFTALDVIDDMVQEILDLRRAKKIYSDFLNDLTKKFQGKLKQLRNES